MAKIVHRYMGLTEWSLCGRWLGFPHKYEEAPDVIGTDKAHEVNCKACKSIGENKDVK